MPIHTGLDEKARETVAKQLAALLADTYYLYLKTQNYHWNVVSPHFEALHQMFEKQYQDLAQAVDDLAERIRALGHYAPGSYAQFSNLTVLEEAIEVPTAHTMIQHLLADHETLCHRLREGIQQAEDVRDEATVDMLIARLQTHEKTAWMLRASASE